jgi:hypothetical protein
MTEPKRIQRKRTKGWRMPEGTIYVGRPTRWGNPYRWADYPAVVSWDGEPTHVPAAVRRRYAVVDFKSAVAYGVGGLPGYPSLDEITTALADHDLACWCPLDQPCHADVLLEIANGGER